MIPVRGKKNNKGYDTLNEYKLFCVPEFQFCGETRHTSAPTTQLNEVLNEQAEDILAV